MKLRLDKALVARKLAESRTRAQELVRAGQVEVEGIPATRPSEMVGPDDAIELHGKTLAFVSRGGLKLAAALDHWNIDLSGRNCLDIGISTGGFADCMLQRGAASVLGIDSGHGQLAARLQAEPRLQLLERTNARHLTSAMLPAGISFFAMDVSFIAASLVLPAVIGAAFSPSRLSSDREAPNVLLQEAVVLVKPQFEAGKEFIGKHGIVRSEVAHLRAIERVRQTADAHGARTTEVMDSPILGGEGNREFLLYARF